MIWDCVKVMESDCQPKVVSVNQVAGCGNAQQVKLSLAGVTVVGLMITQGRCWSLNENGGRVMEGRADSNLSKLIVNGKHRAG